MEELLIRHYKAIQCPSKNDSSRQGAKKQQSYNLLLLKVYELAFFAPLREEWTDTIQGTQRRPNRHKESRRTIGFLMFFVFSLLSSS